MDKSQVSNPEEIKKIIDFLCSESGSHDYTINRREAKTLGLNIEKPSQDLYEILRTWLEAVREELELQVPFDQNAVLGANSVAQYHCVRCLLESTAAKGQIFVSEGELKRVQVVHPQFVLKMPSRITDFSKVGRIDE